MYKMKWVIRRISDGVYFTTLKMESIRNPTHDCSAKTLYQPNLLHYFYYFANETLKASDTLFTSLTPYIQSWSSRQLGFSVRMCEMRGDIETGHTLPPTRHDQYLGA